MDEHRDASHGTRLVRRRFLGLSGAGLAALGGGLIRPRRWAAAQEATPAASPAATPVLQTTFTGQPVVGNEQAQIGWSNGINDLPVIASMKGAMDEYAASIGYQMLYDTGQQANIQAEVQAIQSWITQGIPAICCNPLEPSAFEPLAQQAIDRGLIWTVYGPKDMETSPHAWIGFTSEQSGQQVADAVVEWINANDPEAKVLIFKNSNIPASLPRSEIPEQAIRERTKATVVGVQDAFDQVKGLQVTQTFLQSNPDLSVVVGENDDGALGAVQAFSNADRDPAGVYIVGNDGSLDALNAIKERGFMKATAALPLGDLARAVVQINAQLAESGPPAEKIDLVIPSEIVTADSPRLDELIAFFG